NRRKSTRYGVTPTSPDRVGRCRGTTVLATASADLFRRPPSAQNERPENHHITTAFAAIDLIQIGIPEGALDVKRALTERAIFFSAEGRVPVGCVPRSGCARAR